MQSVWTSRVCAKLYAGLSRDAIPTVADQVFGDATFVSGARHVARSFAAHGAPVYLYHFDYVLERRRGKVPGAAHGVEIPYVFDAFGKLPTVVQMMTTPKRRSDGGDRCIGTGSTSRRAATRTDKICRGGRILGESATSGSLLRPKIEVIAKFRAPQLDFFQQRWEGAEAR